MNVELVAWFLWPVVVGVVVLSAFTVVVFALYRAIHWITDLFL